MRRADPRPQEAQVVVHLRDRADGGAGVVAAGLLLDRDGRGEALDRVHVGLLHESEELAGVGRERLDATALPPSVDRVERERRFTRTPEAGDERKAVSRGVDGDVLQAVLAGAAGGE